MFVGYWHEGAETVGSLVSLSDGRGENIIGQARVISARRIRPGERGDWISGHRYRLEQIGTGRILASYGRCMAVTGRGKGGAA